jgi:hypothetical protein
MSDTFKFDYKTFYNYYKDDSNLEKFNEDQPIAYFYVKDKKTKRTKLSQDKLSDKYIKINDKIIHVKEFGTYELLFSIPKKINNIEWDDHFHFGKDDNFESRNKKNKHIHSVIFFHKTIQKPDENNKITTSCYYNPIENIELKNFENMECIQRGNKMRELFSKDELFIIKEIISRPFKKKAKKTFLEVLTGKKPSGKGGTKKKTRRYRRKSVRR